MFTIAIKNLGERYEFYSWELIESGGETVHNPDIKNGLEFVRSELIKRKISPKYDDNEVYERFGKGYVYHIIDKELVTITGKLKKGTFTSQIDPKTITKINVIKSAFQPPNGEDYAVVINSQDTDTKNGECQLVVKKSVFHGCSSKEDAEALAKEIGDTVRGTSGKSVFSTIKDDDFLSFDNVDDTNGGWDDIGAKTISKELKTDWETNEDDLKESFTEFEKDNRRFKSGNMVEVTTVDTVYTAEFVQHWEGNCIVKTPEGKKMTVPSENITLI